MVHVCVGVAARSAAPERRWLAQAPSGELASAQPTLLWRTQTHTPDWCNCVCMGFMREPGALIGADASRASGAMMPVRGRRPLGERGAQEWVGVPGGRGARSGLGGLSPAALVPPISTALPAQLYVPVRARPGKALLGAPAAPSFPSRLRLIGDTQWHLPGGSTFWRPVTDERHPIHLSAERLERVAALRLSGLPAGDLSRTLGQA